MCIRDRTGNERLDAGCKTVARNAQQHDGRVGNADTDGKPVSYTHLDVYKRQALMGVELLKFPLLHADDVLLVVKQDRPAAGSALIQ